MYLMQSINQMEKFGPGENGACRRWGPRGMNPPRHPTALVMVCYFGDNVWLTCHGRTVGGGALSRGTAGGVWRLGAACG
jgi:hypothetical protein